MLCDATPARSGLRQVEGAALVPLPGDAGGLGCLRKEPGRVHANPPPHHQGTARRT